MYRKTVIQLYFLQGIQQFFFYYFHPRKTRYEQTDCTTYLFHFPNK